MIKHLFCIDFVLIIDYTCCFRAIDVGLCCNTPGKAIFFGGLYFSIILTGILSIYENPISNNYIIDSSVC